MGGGGRHMVDVVRAYWRSEERDAEPLLEYAIRYGRGTVFKRMGYLAERFASVPDAWLVRCQEHVTKGVSELDPAGPKRGKIVSHWNLRVNVPIDEARP